MTDERLIQVEIVQGDIEHRLPLGEFTHRIVSELKGICFKSRLFSTKGEVDPAELDRAYTTAVDKVIQRIRDEKA